MRGKGSLTFVRPVCLLAMEWNILSSVWEAFPIEHVPGDRQLLCPAVAISNQSALAYVTLWQAQGARVEKDEEAFPKSLYFLRDFPDSAKQLST